jgi:hypothetical protein
MGLLMVSMLCDDGSCDVTSAFRDLGFNIDHLEARLQRLAPLIA